MILNVQSVDQQDDDLGCTGTGSKAGTMKGPPPTSDCHPTCRSIAWLVLPAGDMLSTNVFMADQSSLNCREACGHGPYYSGA